MSLVSMIKGRRGASGFGYASTAEEVTDGLDLRGKTFLVTGTTSGLGLETARVLGKRGARVIALARTKDKAAESLRSAGADAAGRGGAGARSGWRLGDLAPPALRRTRGRHPGLP